MSQIADRKEASVPGSPRFQRLFDILLSFCLIVFLLPLIVFTCLAIKIESRGPAVFRQRRIGWNGHDINIRKFRTMYGNSESMVIRRQSLETDPRVTRVGRFLRQSSLDELPQLFDVLSGQLTLIGPRPILPYETAKLNPDLLEERLGYKPGLTGWAQVNGLRGGPTSVESFERMIDLDIDYMRRRTFLTDMKILWRTVIGIFLKGNAY